MSTQLDQSHHVLIVGATKGIGFALAGQLAEQRVRVTLSGRTAANVEQALTRLRAHHPTAQPQGIVLDLRDQAAVRRALPGVGPIDALVLCEGSDIAWGPFASLSMEAVERALHMKLTGYLNAVQAAMAQLTERASITFVGGAASRAALSGTVGLAAVNGSLEAVTRTLARELAPRRVNLVSPGLTDTEAYDALPAQTKVAQFASAAARLPVGRTGLPDDISHAIRLVMNNPFVTGSIVDVDGGAYLG